MDLYPNASLEESIRAVFCLNPAITRNCLRSDFSKVLFKELYYFLNASAWQKSQVMLQLLDIPLQKFDL
jgi:hypothetical protein